MLFLRYLGHELRARLRQAVLIGTGLALGTGLVITASAATAGVQTAQASVLRTLYGVGTDITVTRTGTGSGTPPIRPRPVVQHLDFLAATGHGLLGGRTPADIARLPHVLAAVGWLALTDTKLTIPAVPGSPAVGRSPAAGQAPAPLPEQLSIDGVDTSQPRRGPLGQAAAIDGRLLAPADANRDVVLADAGYASQTGLHTGSRVTLAGQRFTIVGIVRQPPGVSAQLLIPLRRAQLLSGLGSQLSSVAVQADSAADVGVVSREISAALPWAQLTTSAALAAAVTGSLASAARLASELGRWVAAASLAAAVTLASLLTLAAVGHRVTEFGTLKAMGWRTGRVVAQVVGESAVAGGCGALTGIVLGFGGATLVSALAPALTATVLPGAGAAGPATDPDAGPATLVHLHAPVTIDTVLVAVLLGIAGGLLAGAIGGWRAARLRPADAMTRVG